MEYAVDHYLLQVSREKLPGYLHRIELLEILPADLGKVPPVHEAEREHAPRSVLGEDFRGDQFVKVGYLAADQAGVLAFQAKIELLVQALLKLTHHPLGAVPRPERCALRGE